MKWMVGFSLVFASYVANAEEVEQQIQIFNKSNLSVQAPGEKTIYPGRTSMIGDADLIAAKINAVGGNFHAVVHRMKGYPAVLLIKAMKRPAFID